MDGCIGWVRWLDALTGYIGWIMDWEETGEKAADDEHVEELEHVEVKGKGVVWESKETV